MSHDVKTNFERQQQARFFHYHDGNFFYVVKVEDRTCRFPIPTEDAKGATRFAEFKAMTPMRSIRKALEDKTFQPANWRLAGREGSARNDKL